MANELLIQMVRDLEETREKYWGFPYIRTMRNILIGKENAVIAPAFKGKPYYSRFKKLRLDELEIIMDSLVRAGYLRIRYTNRGKLYCSCK